MNPVPYPETWVFILGLAWVLLVCLTVSNIFHAIDHKRQMIKLEEEHQAAKDKYRREKMWAMANCQGMVDAADRVHRQPAAGRK